MGFNAWSARQPRSGGRHGPWRAHRVEPDGVLRASDSPPRDGRLPRVAPCSASAAAVAAGIHDDGRPAPSQ